MFRSHVVLRREAVLSIRNFAITDILLGEAAVLQNIPFAPIYTYEHRPAINASIILDMIRSLRSGEFSFSESKILNIVAQVKYHNPRVIISFEDNAGIIESLRKRFSNIHFITVQNGQRIAGYGGDSADVFFCFGYHEAKNYRAYNPSVTVKRIVPCGSVKGSYFSTTLKENKTERYAFDLCYISHFRSSIMSGEIHPEIRNSLDLLESHLIRYAKEANVRIIIPLAPKERDAQKAYFEKRFHTIHNKVQMIDYAQDFLGTYRVMYQSRLIFSYTSAAGVEGFGLGYKVLFCQFGETTFSHFPEGPWLLRKDDYTEFRMSVNRLLCMPQEEYLKTSTSARHYLMNNRPLLPAHLLVNKYIRQQLKGSPAV